MTARNQLTPNNMLSKRLKYATAIVSTLAVMACTLSETEMRMQSTHVNSSQMSWRALVDSGKKDFKNGHYGLALEKFRTAQGKVPDSVLLLNAIAATYDQLNRFELSERYYVRALAMAPTSVQTLNNFGYSLMLQRKYKQALAYLSRAAESESSDKSTAMAKRNYRIAYYKSTITASKSSRATLHNASLGKGQTVALLPISCPVGPVWLEKSGERVYTLVTRPTSDAKTSMQNLMSGQFQMQIAAKDSPGANAAACGASMRDTFRFVPRITKSPTTEIPEKAFRKPAISKFLQQAKTASATYSPSVELSNGAGRVKLAARVYDYFSSKGLAVARLTNDDSFNNDETIIFYREGFIQQARGFASHLPMPVTLQLRGGLAADIRIRLGRDIYSFDDGFLGKAKKFEIAMKESWT